MDLDDMAGQAVGIVVDYARRVASSVGEHVVTTVADGLVEQIEHRLAEDDFGRGALARVLEQPDDTRRAQALVSVVAETAENDAQFAAALTSGLDEARQAGLLHSGFTGASRVSIGKVGRSHLSFGSMTITNIRQSRVAVGIAGALVVAVALLALSQRSGGGSNESSVNALTGTWAGSDEEGDPQTMLIRDDRSVGLNLGDLGCTGTVTDETGAFRFDVDCGLARYTGEGTTNSDVTQLTIEFTGDAGRATYQRTS